MYDCIIIGAGTSGMTAGVLAFQKKLKVLVIAEKITEFAEEDETGFINFEKIKKKFEKDLEFNKTEVISIEKNVVSFSVEIKSGEIIYSRSIIVASGSDSEEFDEITEKDHEGRIKVDSNMATSVEGVYAIGSANDSNYYDVVISVGEAAKAVSAVKSYLN